MPELPEVETTRRGIAPHLCGRRISGVTVRQAKMRWPVPDDLAQQIGGLTVVAVERRAKYLLLRFAAKAASGERTLILHLGMSGSLRICSDTTPAGRHDHLDLLLDNGSLLRLCDPRRFGGVMVVKGDPLLTPHLQRLGPEPLSAQFNSDYLLSTTTTRSRALKLHLMDQAVVV
ncbi:MAG: formamidopyrimidine-DNA glycosylase, partial [Gammaproteobacteria bacterium]|nr:formamidopyrimidine-DNA glycosylase [Gammaproteobacteria bacterium]